MEFKGHERSHQAAAGNELNIEECRENLMFFILTKMLQFYTDIRAYFVISVCLWTTLSSDNDSCLS